MDIYDRVCSGTLIFNTERQCREVVKDTDF